MQVAVRAVQIGREAPRLRRAPLPVERVDVDLAAADPGIVLITGDLGFKVFDDYRANLPAQFINAGVAEQQMTMLATGMALASGAGRSLAPMNNAGCRATSCLYDTYSIATIK